MKMIKRIVLTGGPCSGKSTFMSRAEEIFAERGYRVMIDHEAATDLITGGISPATMGMYQFQKYCIALQLKKEELFDMAAEEIDSDRVLIFYDRGVLDDKGYVSDEEFTEILSGFNLTEADLIKQYDFVLHLTTAAKGAEEAYTLSNNAARYEGIEDARRVDDTTLAGWSAHPNRVVIDNESDFDEKMRKAIQAIFAYLGDERPIEVSKKYLVEINDELISKLKETASKVHIVQHYLKSQSGNERRIRRREKEGNTIYYYSDATMLTPNTRIKKDRIISESQYQDYAMDIDPSVGIIDKERYSFYHNGRFFKLDIFSFDQSKALLSVQIPDESEEIVVPDYFNVVKEVTDILNYKNYYLAKFQKF